MRVVTNISQTKQILNDVRCHGKTIGFVPTMGYLHEGHLALLRRSVSENDYTVMSVFVNPLQFGPSEDYHTYPRDLENDCRLAEKVGVDLVFAPTVEEMYPPGFCTTVEVSEVTKHLCGASRPGHFTGVATVVTKLFNIVQPNRAYFGLKDYQQAVVIKRMVRDLNINVEIVTVPTVRESDGLAMSSRNSYLSPEERQAATVLYKSLQMAEQLIQQGCRDPDVIKNKLVEFINKEPLAKIDYVEIVDPENLKPLTGELANECLVALAVRIGQTRLIDNKVIEMRPHEVV